MKFVDHERGWATWVTAAITMILLWGCLASWQAYANSEKKRIFVVSSYHREYLWSQDTNRGLTDAMLKYGYLDTTAQVAELSETDHVESSKAVVRKVWMDTKRRNSLGAIASSTHRIMGELDAFRPNLVLLGDDNAANYIGNQLLDTDIPAVFWGINGLPLKYGLVDNMDAPGHNITGVWQTGYLKESMELLHALVPDAKTFAIIACDSVSARPHVKKLQAMNHAGELPLRLIDTVSEASFSAFKTKVLRLAPKVDAFFVLNHDTLHDDEGAHVDMLDVGRWYLENVNKPEASHEDQFVREGMLLTANDSGYNQGYDAFEMAYDILEQGLNPAHMRTKTSARGPFMVNRKRADMLGIDLTDKMDLIDIIVESSLALEQ